MVPTDRNGCTAGNYVLTWTDSFDSEPHNLAKAELPVIDLCLRPDSSPAGLHKNVSRSVLPNYRSARKSAVTTDNLALRLRPCRYRRFRDPPQHLPLVGLLATQLDNPP